jgi:hypothetical protein
VSTDTKASFSNFGAAVDVWAPGVKVQSVGITSNSARAVLSGTSMGLSPTPFPLGKVDLKERCADEKAASPHAAGLAAYLISLEGLNTPAAVSNRIKQLAGVSGAAAKGVSAATATLIAYNGDGFG